LCLKGRISRKLWTRQAASYQIMKKSECSIRASLAMTTWKKVEYRRPTTLGSVPLRRKRYSNPV
jgi:hypothetical protein